MDSENRVRRQHHMSQLTKALIEQSGSKVGAIQPQEIKWYSRGELHTATALIKPAGYDTFIEAARFGRNEDGTPTVDVMVARLLVCVVDEAGAPLFELSDIVGDPVTGEGRMCETLFVALTNAVSEVNTYKATDEGK